MKYVSREGDYYKILDGILKKWLSQTTPDMVAEYVGKDVDLEPYKDEINSDLAVGFGMFASITKPLWSKYVTKKRIDDYVDHMQYVPEFRPYYEKINTEEGRKWLYKQVRKQIKKL